MRSTKLNFTFFGSVMLFSMSLMLFLSSCKKDSTPAPTPADKTALQAKIAEAQLLYDATVEGTKPGQYEAGSKNNFLTVLNAAKSVVADANATQTAVTNALAQLQAAMDTYKTHLIKEIASNNLIGFWKLNGNAADSSGKGNNGTLTAGHAYYGGGMPTATADRFGRANMAYFFDKGGNIEVPYTSALNPQQFSISIWLKKNVNGRTINTDTYTMMSLNRWNGYKFQLQSANKLFLTVKAVNGADTAYYDRDDETAVLDTNVWYHAIVTYKPGEMDFYVNGDLVKSWTNTPNPPITLSNPINFVIGQDLPTSKYLTVDGDYQVAWGGYWTGALDDIMFYNVALDATQVKSIYNNQKSL
ncbi:MAG: LamG-like jellyroll fold domain-containing protein [Flavisolibacter sp.]